MTPRTLAGTRIVLVSIAAAGVVAALAAPRERMAPPVPPLAAQTTAPGAAEVRPEATGLLERVNPFRSDLSHPLLRYDPGRPPPPPPPPPLPSPTRPAWTLSGVLSGPNPVAILNGLSEADSTRLVQLGDTVEGRVVSRIAPDTIVLTERDSTWTFVLGGPWAPGGPS